MSSSYQKLKESPPSNAELNDKNNLNNLEIEEEEEQHFHRNLESRHLSMIAIGGAIGTGLFIGSGSVLSVGGPTLAIISYAFAGLVVFFMLTSLGEMCAMLPVTGSFASYCTRFAEPALGFTVGWNYWLIYILTLPAELLACANILQFWWPEIPKWVIILSVLLVIVTVNLCGVGWFGEVEYWLSMIKVAALLIFLLMGLAIFFKDNVGLSNYNTGPTFGQEGGWLGFLAILPSAFFAYSGTEIIAVSAREADDPAKAIPAAISTTFTRISFFYIGSMVILSLLVPQTHPSLSTGGGASSVLASPFVIALELAKIPEGADLINGIIFIALLSSANSCIYATARTLQGLALAGQAPSYFKKTSVNGVPVRQIAVSSLFALLSLLSELPGGNSLLHMLIKIVGIQVIITYLIICWIHLRLRRALEYQEGIKFYGGSGSGKDGNRMSYMAPFFPYSQYVAIISLSLLLLSMCLKPLLILVSYSNSKFTITEGISTYSGVVLYLLGYFSYKIFSKKKSGFVKVQEIDLATGRVYPKHPS